MLRKICSTTTRGAGYHAEVRNKRQANLVTNNTAMKINNNLN